MTTLKRWRQLELFPELAPVRPVVAMPATATQRTMLQLIFGVRGKAPCPRLDLLDQRYVVLYGHKASRKTLGALVRCGYVTLLEGRRDVFLSLTTKGHDAMRVRAGLFR